MISRRAAVVVASNDHSPLPRVWVCVVRSSATYPVGGWITQRSPEVERPRPTQVAYGPLPYPSISS